MELKSSKVRRIVKNKLNNVVMDLREEVDKLKFENKMLTLAGCDFERRLDRLEEKQDDN